MLFLLRPRQTWMPFALPRGRSQQQAYNKQLAQSYAATHRVARNPAERFESTGDPIASLRELALLHDSGALTDEEFAIAKGRVLNREEGPTT